jgi:hypothetical protein
MIYIEENDNFHALLLKIKTVYPHPTKSDLKYTYMDYFHKGAGHSRFHPIP